MLERLYRSDDIPFETRMVEEAEDMTKVAETYSCEVSGNKFKVLGAGKGTRLLREANEACKIRIIKSEPIMTRFGCVFVEFNIAYVVI